MDAVITYDEILESLKNPPPIGKRPNFFSLRELRKHIILVLKQIPHPSFPIQGWSGMAMQPALFALLDPTPFAVPVDPGLYATYEQYDLAPAIKMKDNLFKTNKHMYKTYINIKRAVFATISLVIPERFRTSNNPSITGWNQTMSVNDILDQLDITYGQPGASELLTNQTLWHAPHSNQEEPEALFLRLEQCQEVATLAKNEYSTKQMITNAVLILRQSNIFPTKDFDEWGDTAETNQTWPIMRAFFHKKYTKRMTEIMMSAGLGRHGYANANAYGAFNMGHNDDDSASTEGTTTTTIAAATANLPGSTMGMGTTVAPEITSAIAQLAANQSAIMTQMAALTIAPPRPPIQQITIPTQQFTAGGGGRGGGYRGNYYGGGYNGGRNNGYGNNFHTGGGGRGSQSRGYGGYGRGRRGRESFAQAVQGRGGIPNAGPPLFGGNTQTTGGIPSAPNPVKRFNNWNYCFSCGFDVEDNHTSQTCPAHWRKAGHQQDCTHNNVQQYAAAGHNPSMRGQHKIQLPPAAF